TPPAGGLRPPAPPSVSTFLAPQARISNHIRHPSRQNIDQVCGEFGRAGQHHHVASRHFVRDDAEAFPDVAAGEVGGEAAVVAAEQVSGGDVRPGGEGPGFVDRAVHVHVLVERGVVGQHAFGEVAGDVVQVQLVVVVDAGRGRAAPLPPFVRSLAGGGDHGGEQDERDGGGAGADERADDTAPR